MIVDDLGASGHRVQGGKEGVGNGIKVFAVQGWQVPVVYAFGIDRMLFFRYTMSGCTR